MADLVLGLDYNITKAEAQMRKLQREYDIQKKKIENQKIKITASEENFDKVSAELEEARNNVKVAQNELKEYQAQLTEYESKGMYSAAEKTQRIISEKQRELENYKKVEQQKAAISTKEVQNLEKQELKLQELEARLRNIGDRIASNNKKQSGFGTAIKNNTKPLAVFGRRIRELIKSALIFSVITKALNAMREALGKYLKQDSKLSKSIAQLKGNLATIGATISSALAPYIQWVVNKLVYITSLVGNVLARLLGKDVEQMAALAEATTDTAKAAEKAKGSLAGFDEINTLSQQEDAPSSQSAPTIDTSSITNIDDSQIDNFIQKCKDALPWVTAIGGVLAGWSIIKLLKNFETLNTWLSGGKITGILMIIAGLILLIWNYCDAWTNGIDWNNFAGIIVGIALIAGGLALVFGEIGAGIALIVGGIAMVVLGIKDWIENGKSLQSVLTVVVGILAIGLSLMLLGLGWPALLVAAIVAAIVLIAAYWEEIKSAVSNFISWFSENVLDRLFGEGVGDALQGMWDSFTLFFEDIIDFFKNVFKGDWKEAWKSLVNVLVDVLNFAINRLNYFIQGFLGGFAKGIKGIGKLFGQNWNWDVSNIKIPNVPRLATGAILPGGSPMLAWVNDQPKGQTYVEGSVDNIAAALEKVMTGKNYGDSNQTIVVPVYINDREIARATRSGNESLGNQTVFGGFANAY